MDCCTPGGDPAYERQFDDRHAADQAAGVSARTVPRTMTRRLIDALAAGGLEGRTVLEIGGGVGAVHHELLRDGSRARRGCGRFTSAYIEAADGGGRVSRDTPTGCAISVGDFVRLADDDRAGRHRGAGPGHLLLPGREARWSAGSSAQARRRYGLVYPRDTLARPGSGSRSSNLGHRWSGVVVPGVRPSARPRWRRSSRRRGSSHGIRGTRTSSGRWPSTSGRAAA